MKSSLPINDQEEHSSAVGHGVSSIFSRRMMMYSALGALPQIQYGLEEYARIEQEKVRKVQLEGVDGTCEIFGKTLVVKKWNIHDETVYHGLNLALYGDGLRDGTEQPVKKDSRKEAAKRTLTSGLNVAINQALQNEKRRKRGPYLGDYVPNQKRVSKTEYIIPQAQSYHSFGSPSDRPTDS